jgi:hypothetical protein
MYRVLLVGVAILASLGSATQPLTPEKAEADIKTDEYV